MRMTEHFRQKIELYKKHKKFVMLGEKNKSGLMNLMNG
jgi:hypothetical protein